MTKNTFNGHDTESEAMAIEILTRMKFPTSVVVPVSKVIGQHMKCHDISKIRKIHKIRKLLGQHHIELLTDLVTADEKSTIHEGMEKEVKFAIERKAFEKRFPVMLPDPIVTGKDLIEAGVKPGPAFKFALDNVFNSQLDGCEDKGTLVRHALGFVKQFNNLEK
jgi:poly(A) polymerase